MCVLIGVHKKWVLICHLRLKIKLITLINLKMKLPIWNSKAENSYLACRNHQLPAQPASSSENMEEQATMFLDHNTTILPLLWPMSSLNSKRVTTYCVLCSLLVHQIALFFLQDPPSSTRFHSASSSKPFYCSPSSLQSFPHDTTRISISITIFTLQHPNTV